MNKLSWRCGVGIVAVTLEVCARIEDKVRAGLSERPELFAWASASVGMELGTPATRAKALNVYTGTFSRV
jgi:hypothetical protein